MMKILKSYENFDIFFYFFLKFLNFFNFFDNFEILKSGKRNADDNYRMSLVRAGHCFILTSTGFESHIFYTIVYPYSRAIDHSATPSMQKNSFSSPCVSHVSKEE
jgi:hypothetical protein